MQSAGIPAQGQMAYAQQANRIRGVPGGQPAGGGIINDPLLAEMVAAGATPLQAAQLVQQDRASKAQEARRSGAMTSLANAPGANDPFLGALTAGADAAGSAVGAALNTPITFTDIGPVGTGPGGNRQYEASVGDILDLYNKAYDANVRNVGENIYTAAMTGQTPALDNTLNPFDYYFYVDGGVENWSLDPANKDKIKAIYENGLDINEDGTVDVAGADAVWLAYTSEVHPGFIDNLITQMALDPLFAASFVAPAAGAAREGVQTAEEIAIIANMPRAQRVSRAIDRALSAVTKAGDVGNMVADLPFTVPIEIARRVGQGVERAPGFVRKGVGWIADPAPGTIEQRAMNEAVDVADVAQGASAIPTYQTQPAPGVVRTDPYQLPERSVTNPPEYIGTPYGIAPTNQPMSYPNLARYELPERSAVPGPADYVTGPGGQTVRADSGINPDYSAGTPALPSGRLMSYPELAPRPAPEPRRPLEPVDPIPMGSGEIPAPVSKKTVAGKPQWSIGDDGQVRVRTVPGTGYVVEQRGTNGKFARIGEPFTDATEAVRSGQDIVGPTRMDVPPGTVIPSTGAELTAPAPRTIATEGMTREQRMQAIKEGRISPLTPVPGGPRLVDQAWDRGASDLPGWERFRADYQPKAQAYLQRAASVEQRYYDDFSHKVADQVIGGIEHTVDEVAPSFRSAFGDMPDIPPTSERMVASTKSGKASYQQENLPYLYQRYVFTESEKDASKILETLRKRPEIDGAPWSEDALTRLIEARQRLRTLYAEADQGMPGGINAAGFTYDPALAGRQAADATLVGLNRLSYAPGDLAERYLGPRMGEPRIPDQPDFNVDDMGSLERYLASDEFAIQAARGALPQETADYLRQPIRTIELKRGGKWAQATRQELDAFAESSGLVIPARGDLTGADVRLREMTHADLLQEVMRQMPDATPAEISQAFAERVLDLTGVRVPPPKRLAPVIRHLLGGMRTVSNIARESALYNVVTGTRGFLGDFASDTFRQALEGHVGAALRGVTGVDYIKRLAGSESEAARIARQYGEDLPADLKVMRGRTEIAAEGKTTLHEVVSRRVGVEDGGAADRAIGILTGVADSKLFRDGRNAADNVRREAVFVSEIEKRELQMGRAFRARGRGWAEKHGILPTSFDAYVAELGQRFSPDDLHRAMRELADDAGLAPDMAENFADRLRRWWVEDKRKLFKAADAEQKRVHLSYERTNLDNFLANFIFYHYWMSRSIPAYARIALRNPEIAAMWMRAWQEVENRAEREGYPDTMRGYIRFMGSGAGWNHAWNPLNIILPLADMRPEAQTDGWYDELTQFVMVNPVISYAASALGLTDDIVDPFMSYSVRNMVMSGINEIRARTGRPPLLNDPYEVVLRHGTDFLNDVLTRVGLPGAKRRQYADPATYSQSEINYTVATVIAEQTGVPTDQWAIDGPEYRMWTQAIADGYAGIDNPIFQEAFQRWADADLVGRGFNSVIPGGVRTRFGPRDAQMGNPDLTDQEQEFKGIVNSGGAESANLSILDRQYKDIGTDRQQSISEGYNSIRNPDEKIPDYFVINIGDTQITAGDLREMDDDGRRDIAEFWVASVEGTEELQAYWDERSAFVEAHPEFGAFDDWKDVGYKYEGGPRQYRLDRAAGNPNFKRAMQGQEQFLKERGVDPKLIPDELDGWAMSVSGYMAAQGIRDSVYGQDPISTGDQGTVNTILRAGGGGSGGGGSSAPKSTSAKLRADMAEYQKELAIFDQVLAGAGIEGGFASINNPIMLRSLEAQFGDILPSMSSLMRQYLEWADAVAKIDPNADTSPEAFARVLDQMKAAA